MVNHFGSQGRSLAQAYADPIIIGYYTGLRLSKAVSFTRDHTTGRPPRPATRGPLSGSGAGGYEISRFTYFVWSTWWAVALPGLPKNSA